MGTELTTTALDQVVYYSWWWTLAPLVIGVFLIVLGAKQEKELVWGPGIMVFIVGTLGVTGINASGPSYDKDLLRSDVAEQLRIEATVKDGDWYIGRGQDGEYVRFTLLEKDGAENTYAMLVEK